MMNKKGKVFSVAALCAAGILAWNIGGSEAHPGNGASQGEGFRKGNMLSWSQQEALRENHEALMQNREKQMQALGKTLFAPESAPGEGRLFSSEAVQKAGPMMEQMFLDHYKAFEEGRKMLTRDQQELMQGRMRMGQKDVRSGRRFGYGSQEVWGMGFMGGYFENALGLTPSQKESFRKNMEIDGVTLKKHEEAREKFFQALRQGTPSEEQLRSMAGERAAFWGECAERMNGALEKLYPTFSENQKKAFEEMRGRMAENMEAGLFMTPRMGHPREGRGDRDNRDNSMRPRDGRGGEKGSGKASDSGKNMQGNAQGEASGGRMFRNSSKTPQGQ
ncbi:MAG TPA: Spy/CpxP family protein refolding chaperone [Synergistaceae bacterium]|nr:Spy/CpxP family protein refolding chaperone [Synergistaceae bacterium]HPJ26324.1 Spy/CpxP family protein refolding chaperone [Synergistaceae bacterium]HPQ37768.1 Spy/CpxP family protein refolding chaperone [Synergistaceae bacterium]